MYDRARPAMFIRGRYLPIICMIAPGLLCFVRGRTRPIICMIGPGLLCLSAVEQGPLYV